MRKIIIINNLIIGLFIQNGVLANQSDFTYFDASYIQRSVDNLPVEGGFGIFRDFDFTGFRLRAGLALNERWIIDAQYLDTSKDDAVRRERLPASSIGGGAPVPGGETYTSTDIYTADFTQSQLSLGYKIDESDFYKVYFLVGHYKLSYNLDYAFQDVWLDINDNELPSTRRSFSRPIISGDAEEIILSLFSNFKLTDKLGLGLRAEYVKTEDASTGFTAELDYKLTKNLSIFSDVFIVTDERQLGLGAKYYY